ncbi:MAG: RNA methyltransferase [Alphaproteobacteria bacterium]|nr:RNA methyltransferase [Alphaproteobacteria bacterium]
MTRPGPSRGSRPPAPPDSLWLYGLHAVRAALANPGRTVLEAVATRNAAQELGLAEPAVRLVDPRELSRLLPPEAVHQGAAIRVRPLPDAELDTLASPATPGAPLVVLDQVTDPHNVGAILRSAAAFGALGLVMTTRNAPRESGVLAKAASGALEAVPIARVVNLARALDTLKDSGWRVIGLEGGAPAALPAFVDGDPLALVFGAEGAGLRELTRKTCDSLARLPTRGSLASLNVSNAVAVALYVAGGGSAGD